jgi:hypothetical protein
MRSSRLILHLSILELSVDPKNAIDAYCASQIQLLTRLHASKRQGRRD